MNFGAILQGLFRVFQTAVALSNNDASKQRMGQVAQMAQFANTLTDKTSFGGYYESPLSSVATFLGGAK